MPAQIHQIFIVVVSVNHGFDRIKGGFWSIVNTKNEEELMSVLMKTAQKHRLHIMASVSRDEASWRVKELSDYCPVENGEKTPLQNQIDKLIRDRYLKEVPV
jgi:stress response protein SCP2